ncbi:MAG: CoA transferase, partial [Pseudomonadota bacterium]
MLLTPYRVLDLTRSYGMLCGQMLADLGADVIQIEPPGGADGRGMGPFLDHTPDPEHSLYWWGYSRGKRSMELDIAAQAQTFEQLVASADILIESEPLDGQAALPLAYEPLAQLNPGLIYVKISPYGPTGPKSTWAASDITIAASAGPLAMTGDDDRAPVRVSIPQSYNHAAAEAAVGALVALHERVHSGRGQRVDASAQQAMTLATQGNILSAAIGETTANRIAGGLKAGELRIRLTYPAKDGFVSITHIFGATVGPATRRLMEYVYENGFCDEATRDKDWVAYGLLLATGEEPIAEFERVKACVAACTASKTKAELLDAAMQRRLLLAPMTTIEDVVNAEQFADRDYFTRPSGTGPSAQGDYPGPFARFSQTPMSEPLAPPSIGQHTAEILSGLPQASPRESVDSNDAAQDRLPLEGLKVLDFMWALAGPGCTRILADWGATIVRVESSSKLDVIRTVRPFMQGDELPEKSALF